MKSYQKWICLLLVLVMCMSLTVSVFAAGEGEGTDTPVEPETPEYNVENNAEGPEFFGTGDNKVQNNNGKIKITKAVPGEKYDIYQIFYLESYTTGNAQPDTVGNITGGNYSYKVNTAWDEFVNRPGIGVIDDQGNKYLDISTDGGRYVKWNGDATGERAAAFAKLALAYAQEKKMKPVATATATKTQDTNADGTLKVDAEGKPVYKVDFTGLKLGYYLVDTSLGSLCSLDTTNPSVTMQEKNSVPKNEKTTLEGGQWQSNNDMKIGDTVTFKSFIELESGTEKIVFHDKMTPGLTFVNDLTKISVILDASEETRETTKAQTLTAKTHFNVVTADLGDDCTFHITFTGEFYKLITTGSHTITIIYSAVLNENAVVGGTGNTNTSSLEYGNDGHKTTDSTTTTKTWEIPVFKFTLTGTANDIKSPLGGAIFKLSTNQTEPAAAIELIDLGEKPIVIGKNEDGTDKKENWHCYRVATPEEIAKGEGIIKEITTDSTGKFRIQGLDSGTYYLHEVQAPEGYNKLSASIPVQIDSKTGTLRQNERPKENGIIEVQNGTGSELPSTGGIGTTIFYVVGSVLLVGAAVLLITKKRMSAAEE